MAGCEGNEAVQRTRQQEKYGARLMQIAIFVGHRPRPPASSGAPLFPFSFFSLLLFPSFAAAALLSAPKPEKQPARQMCGLLRTPTPGAVVGSGILNSIGAALPHRWIAHACRDGL